MRVRMAVSVMVVVRVAMLVTVAVRMLMAMPVFCHYSRILSLSLLGRSLLVRSVVGWLTTLRCDFVDAPDGHCHYQKRGTSPETGGASAGVRADTEAK